MYFDRYADGDDYDDPAYIANFRLIRQAIAERRKLKVSFLNSREQKRCEILEPVQLEYSDKEDKFRVLCADRQSIKTVNLGRIVQCELLRDTFPENVRLKEREKKVLKFTLTDERNALERAMMKFSHYKKKWSAGMRKIILSHWNTMWMMKRMFLSRFCPSEPT